MFKDFCLQITYIRSCKKDFFCRNPICTSQQIHFETSVKLQFLKSNICRIFVNRVQLYSLQCSSPLPWSLISFTLPFTYLSHKFPFDISLTLIVNYPPIINGCSLRMAVFCNIPTNCAAIRFNNILWLNGFLERIFVIFL